MLGIVLSIIGVIMFLQNVVVSSFTLFYHFGRVNVGAWYMKYFIERLKVVRPDIEVLGRYKNANVSLLVKCKKCGYEWNSSKYAFR